MKNHVIFLKILDTVLIIFGIIEFIFAFKLKKYGFIASGIVLLFSALYSLYILRKIKY